MTEDDGSGAAPAQRLDRWLWFARFFKSRTLAAKACSGRKVRVNRQVISKASATVRPGDVLTFPQGREIRVVRIVDFANRRGPAAEAQTLYEDLAPPELQAAKPAAPPRAGQRERGSGRPAKRERRAVERLRGH